MGFLRDEGVGVAKAALGQGDPVGQLEEAEALQLGRDPGQGGPGVVDGVLGVAEVDAGDQRVIT
jgi:hypothetical protein